MKTIIVNIFLFLVSLSSISQQQYHNLDRTTKYKTDRFLNRHSFQTHTGFKPLLQSQMPFNMDSLYKEFSRDSAILSKMKHPMWWRKFRTEDMLIVNEKDFYLTINPLIDFYKGKDDLDTSLSMNMRGVSINGNITNKLSFQTSFYEIQAFSPLYVRDYVKKNKVIPSQGRYRRFKSTGFDYAYSTGSISFTPLQWLNINLGHGKHFIGEGYRSLLLSDNSYNYPYFKISTNFKKIQYVYMLTSFQRVQYIDLRSLAYTRTHGSFLYLNYIFNNYIQVGVFEGVIFETTDSTSNNNFTASYFNPIIMGRTVQYGLNNNNNVVLGLTTKIKISNGIQLYGQFMLDDNVNKKYGYQIGAKLFEVLSIKNLYFQTEYNWVEPYTYSHVNELQNYSSFNQPLAHTVGSGFSEFVGIFRYRIKDFILYFKANHIITSADNVGDGIKYNTGIDIYKPYETSSINSGVGAYNRTQRTYYNVRIAYLINPVSNFQVFFEFTQRQEFGNVNSNTEFYYFGVRTQLVNNYYDL